MSVSASQATFSPYRFFVGQNIFSDDCKAVANQINYTYSRLETPLIVVNARKYGSQDFTPHLQDRHYTSLTTMYDFWLWFEPNYGSLAIDLGVTALVPTATNVVTTRFTATGATSGTDYTEITTSNAQSGTEQTGTLNLGDAPINGEAGGWVRWQVGWYRSSGAATDNRLLGFRIQIPQIAAGSLP